jgi:putative DNA primase/helicase
MALTFPDAPPGLLDLVFQRGPFARDLRKPTPAPIATAGARPAPLPAGDRAARRKQAAALTALNEEVRQLEGMSDGRYNYLFVAALNLGQLVGAGCLSRSVVESALEAACHTNGLVQKRTLQAVRTQIRSGLERGLAEPRDLSHIDEDAARQERRTPPRRPPKRQEFDPATPREESAASSPTARGATGGGNGGKGEPPAGSTGDAGEPVDPELLAKLAAEPLNDTGNARRLIAHFGVDMLNVREIGEHRWAGTHWERVGGDHAFERFAQIAAERIALEGGHIQPAKRDAAAIEAARPLKAKGKQELTGEERIVLGAGEEAEDRLEKRRADRRKYAISCGNRGRTEAMIKQAKPHITIEPEQLDADPLAINVMNGTLRLVRETVEEEDLECPDPDVTRMIKVKRWRVRLDPHDRKDRLAKLMPVTYDPAAACPRWRTFMARFQPKEGVSAFLQRFQGYALTGLMGEQVFVFNYGLGANGKSTFMETLARLQGAYAQVLPAEALTGENQRRSDQATPEFARLPGARLVRCAELPRGEGFRESTLKMLTGGEPLLVRHLNQGFFEMRPTFKAIGSGNDKPSIKGVDEGIWRRIKLVHWDVTIPVAERRPMETILAEFAEEASGILNWLLEGLIDYLEHGLQVPPEVAAATDFYRNEMDAVGEFMAAHVVPEPGKTVTARNLYEAFVAWCHLNSIKPYAEKTFAGIMMQKGVKKESGRIRTYLDIALKDPPVDPDKPAQTSFHDPDL